MFLHQKFPKSSFFSQIAPIVQGTLLTFLPKKVFFPQYAPAYQALFWLFWPRIQCVFTPKIPKKVNFSLNCDYNTGHFIDFSHKKVIFSSKCACISSTILTFFPNNPLFFTTQIPKKLNCPQIAPNRALYWLSPKKSNFFLKMRMHIEHYFNFFAQ